ncbi:hypothetical protein K2173_000421 [Erythroxylum novogranatense]|uniref:TF-B3 domain-containing protein n=1 Tax=Erythroxylum novogranatense TaxID=1862640 RepID=A0AAV8SXG2_9ROSI|nr:hypothetical protein K2173_000421 [Erythroxylum novogranatense]
MVPTKAHFFQPLLPGFEHTFLIPVSFLMHLNGQDCDRATLRGRLGKLWPVRLNGRRFEDGWLKFVQDHDLHVGDFLVFGHEGDMVFDVMVFDPSACQKEYRIVVKEEQEGEFQEGCEDIAAKEIVVPEELASDEIDTRESTEATQLDVCKQGSAGPSLQKDLSLAAILTRHILSSSIMEIPEEFSRLNNLTGRNCEIIVRDQQGRSWPAVLGHRKSSCGVYIKCSWRAFCATNRIMEGNTITFDLTDKGSTLMLQMVGLTKQPEAKEHLMHCDTKPSSSSIIHPHVSITICEYSLKKGLTIPRKFASTNGLTSASCEMTLLDETEREWPASLGIRKSGGRVWIGKGWTTFARSNQMRAGDVFVLELIKGGKKPVMKFYGQLQQT